MLSSCFSFQKYPDIGKVSTLKDRRKEISQVECGVDSHDGIDEPFLPFRDGYSQEEDTQRDFEHEHA
jgi:hypothetical protein